MDESGLQANGEARIAELKAQGRSRNIIHDDLVADGFTMDEATDLLDGVRLAPRPPPPPSLNELSLHAAREMIAAREPSGIHRQPGAAFEDSRTMNFWEEVLGGRREAEWVLEVPEVAEAVAAEDRLALHRVLSRQRSFAPSVFARELLDEVLANERLFISEEVSVPARGSLLGLHSNLRVGGPRTEQLGTSIGTVWLTFAILPLAPIGRYVIAPGPSRSWIYVGQVPLTRLQAWWRRAALALLLVFAVWFALRVAR